MEGSRAEKTKPGEVLDGSSEFVDSRSTWKPGSLRGQGVAESPNTEEGKASGRRWSMVTGELDGGWGSRRY